MLKGGYEINEFRKVVKSRFLYKSDQPTIKHIVTDSRKFELREGSVFFALSGSRGDGHSYIEDMYRTGVRIFVVSRRSVIPELKNATIIGVDNTLKALQDFAAHHRSLFDFPIVGITGSNGKTIVKEWTYQLLYQDFHVIRSPKSYNSQIGVPLSVMLIDELHDFGVFEAGISQKGEMEYLERMIKPNIGIFTNIGPAHQENFMNLEEKIDEKLKLFVNSEVVIYCRDHSRINARIKKKIDPSKCLTWSMNGPADLQIIHSEVREKKSVLVGEYKGRSRSIEIPFTSSVSIENACHLWLLLLHLKMDDDKIAHHF